MVGLLAVPVTAGCGVVLGGVGGTAPTAEDAPVGVPADDGDGGRAPDDDGSGETGGAGGALIDGRSLIYTGEITVRVDDVARAAGETAALAARYGGFVGGDDRSAGAEHARATVVLRIPSENVAAAVDQLGALGEEGSRRIRTEDVTEEVIDLESRIATARASVERTRELTERARSISDIVALEEELAARESRLAALEARQTPARRPHRTVHRHRDAAQPRRPGTGGTRACGVPGRPAGRLAGRRHGDARPADRGGGRAAGPGRLRNTGPPVTWWVRRRRARRAGSTPAAASGAVGAEGS
ncbi:MAG: DUF4349 domain-containing protein [Micromonosporaceae bacterium]